MTRLVGAVELLRLVRSRLAQIGEAGRTTVERDAGAVTCVLGCAHCCYAKILVHLGEGALMYLHLREARAWSAALEARLVEADHEMTRHRHAEWIAHRRPCAFLVEETPGRGRCSVYEVRPLSCAQTFSVTADPTNCWTTGGRDLTVVSNDSVDRWHVHVIRRVCESIGERKNWAFTLPGAVLYARALIEGLVPPDVHRVAFEDIPEGPLTMLHVFDSTGRRMGT